MNASSPRRPVAPWLIAACGVWLVGLGLYFIALRPPLLPEDTRIMSATVAQSQAARQRRVREVSQPHASRHVPGEDGSHGALVCAVQRDRAPLPQGWQRQAARRPGAHAAQYFVQHWFNLADEACEDTLPDSPALRRFVGIDLGRERLPDDTTLLKFRRRLEDNKLGEALFAKVGEVLQASGLQVGIGTIVDATINAAPRSTKNARGNQGHHGMKLHIGVDKDTGLTHSAVVTAANVHDKHPLPQLLHGQEEEVYGDSACASQQELIASEGTQRAGRDQPAGA